MILDAGILGIWIDRLDAPEGRQWLVNLIRSSRWFENKCHVAVRRKNLPELMDLVRSLRLHNDIKSIVILGNKPEEFEQQIPESVLETHSNLIVLPLPERNMSSRAAERWKKIPTLSDVPTLILPTRSPLGRPPFSTLVIPISGEPRLNQALEYGLNLAAQRGLPVDLLHISPRTSPEFVDSSDEPEADYLEHEYLQQIDYLIAKSSPFSGIQKIQTVRRFFSVFGDVCDEVSRRLELTKKPLLIVDWSGSLASGRARNLKAILSQIDAPVLLVRSQPRPATQLKVGRGYWKTQTLQDF